MPKVYRPFILTAAIIFADQLTKQLIVLSIPENTIGFEFLDGFLRIIHVTNPAVMFSLGAGLPQAVKSVLFIFLPVILLCLIVLFIIKSRELTQLQRWSLCAIVGGGIGNIIDRIFRSCGVVDFIDVKFYGIFGLERWPAFNIADSSIVVGSILLAGTILFSKGDRSEQKT